MNRRTPLVALLLATAIAMPTLSVAPAGAAKKPQPTITVLVTNDDGVAAPGIDAIVEALRQQKKTKVVVVAPAANQSGSAGKTTPGGAQGGPATTASGYPATAVQGFPADTIDYALDVLELKPNAVISGSNLGQNLGPLTEVSGTVGAARQAARRGIPALAISQQLGDAPDFPTSAELAVEWLNTQRKVFAKVKGGGPPIPEIDNVNVPNCPGGPRGLYETIPAPEGVTEPLASTTSDCGSNAASFAHDAAAFNGGYASISKVHVPAAAG